ncbi:MAG TPA: DUF996 domain-containing protein [Thermoplasmatales archaeon]|nr:MAG: DUF996 domain-containing protein [Thermoplasmata archaeon]RLF57575.1 MAG: hypothetical protein DRN37_06240 [Thermoplasmata archaeon]HDN51021.1 DUF996 domain-containing protein [Thermoplasmatales archaeon]
MSNAKVFGGIGAILSLIGGAIPGIGFVMPIVGLVLLFVAVKYISEETRDDSIFRNYLFYFVCILIAIIAAAAIVFVTIGGLSFFTLISEEDFSGEEPSLGFLGALIGGIFIALVIAWVLLIIGTMYLRRSYNHIADHTKVDLFRTTGTVYFIGAITLVILIGALILLIAKILEIIAFFSLPDTLPKVAESETPPPVAEAAPPPE